MRHSFIALTLLVLLPRGAKADIVLTGDYSEHFSLGSKVAGQVLVGLWLGEPRDKVSLEPVRLVLPARPNPLKACVSINTRDGEYWLHGTYSIPPGAPDLGDLSVKSRYAADLAGYEEEDLGVRAELKPDCAAVAPGVFIPADAATASDGQGASPAPLVALINGQRAVRVRLELQASDGTPIPAVTATCAHAEAGRSTAFDTICRVVLPEALAGGEYLLTVERRTRAGDTERDRFRVGLSRAPR